MQLKIVLFLSVLLVEGKGLIHWLEHNLLSCPVKQMTGIDCPGCGFQRSFVALFKGDLLNSFKFYPATIPILVLLVFTAIHLKFELKNGAFFIKILYIAITLIVIINYTYKIFTHQLI